MTNEIMTILTGRRLLYFTGEYRDFVRTLNQAKYNNDIDKFSKQILKIEDKFLRDISQVVNDLITENNEKILALENDDTQLGDEEFVNKYSLDTDFEHILESIIPDKYFGHISYPQHSNLGVYLFTLFDKYYKEKEEEKKEKEKKKKEDEEKKQKIKELEQKINDAQKQLKELKGNTSN